MSRCIRTHNAFHLGDNLVHLNFLRRVALEHPDDDFIHAARWQYAHELREMVEDISNIRISELDHDNYYHHFDSSLPRHKESVNAWRGAGGFWYSHPDRNDFVKFHLDHWFPKMAGMIGINNPVTSTSAMRFNYPAIQQSLTGSFPTNLDVLVINSPPGSGQFMDYDLYDISNLALQMIKNGARIAVTHPFGVSTRNIPCTLTAGLSVAAIGHLSLHCHTILMVSTGPSWPTFNVWNQESVRRRIIFLDSERVNLSPNTIHCRSIEMAKAALEEAGLI